MHVSSIRLQVYLGADFFEIRPSFPPALGWCQLSMQEAALAQEKRRAELTLQELEALPSDTRAYQGVGA